MDQQQHASPPLSLVALSRLEAYEQIALEREEKLQEYMRTTLEDQRQHLAILQHQLTGMDKPRWGTKRIAKAAAWLLLSHEDLVALWWEHTPLEAIQARVAAEIARVEAALTRLQP